MKYYKITVHLITEQDEAEVAVNFADCLDTDLLGATGHAYSVDFVREVEIGEDGKISGLKEAD